MYFHKTLINWYLENKRELPWRKTKYPYHIWLSEVILQQTRVAQGLPYFLKNDFIFPNIPFGLLLLTAPLLAVLLVFTYFFLCASL